MYTPLELPNGDSERRDDARETVASVGGIRIFVRSWQPPAARGIVVICHGFNSHGYYVWTAERLAASGFATWQGQFQGQS